jgi:hypothetical protein
MIMKFRLLVLLFSAFFILSLGNVTLASEKEKESKVTKFESRQLPNEVLYEKALKGELVNNEHTQVTVSEQKEEGTKTIKIHKVLSEEVLPNGEKNTVTSNEYTVLLAGYIVGVRTPPSGAVGLRIRMDYDEKVFSVYQTRKLTKYTITPLKLDSQFDITSFDYSVGTSGSGWTSTGAIHTANENTGRKYITTIVYNSGIIGYPNFQKYTAIGSDIIGGTTLEATVKYRRGTGTITSYHLTFGY